MPPSIAIVDSVEMIRDGGSLAAIFRGGVRRAAAVLRRGRRCRVSPQKKQTLPQD